MRCTTETWVDYSYKMREDQSMPSACLTGILRAGARRIAGGPFPVVNRRAFSASASANGPPYSEPFLVLKRRGHDDERIGPELCIRRADPEDVKNPKADFGSGQNTGAAAWMSRFMVKSSLPQTSAASRNVKAERLRGCPRWPFFISSTPCFARKARSHVRESYV